MPTISQLVRHGRQNKIKKVKAPAMRKNWNSLRRRQVSIAGSDGDESEFNPFLADEEAGDGDGDADADAAALVAEPEEEGAEAK